MIVVFVIDNSGSMNQKTSQGLSLLDCAKSAVEHFLKVRGRDANAFRTDRYFLVTCEESLVSSIKAGWKESFNTFLQELKNLNARELTQLGPSLKRTFDLLNQFRLQTGIDNYGQGRNPWFIEPAVIFLITDGGALSSPSGVQDQLVLPLTLSPGSELTLEPFRWDQRLFTFVLQPPATSSSSSSSSSSSFNTANASPHNGLVREHFHFPFFRYSLPPFSPFSSSLPSPTFSPLTFLSSS
jgi:integrator complex subunit 6